MSKEEIEIQFLKKYGCTTLFEFVDVCLDFDTSLKVLEDYFEKSSQLDEANKKLDKIKEHVENSKFYYKDEDSEEIYEDYYPSATDILSIIGGNNE